MDDFYAALTVGQCLTFILLISIDAINSFAVLETTSRIRHLDGILMRKATS